MKNKGFTLVELLAVVSIISLLLLLVGPKIVNQLNNSKGDINDVTKKLIYNAAEKFIKDYNIEVNESEIKCISINELEDRNYLSSSITDNKAGLDIKENKSIKVKNTGDSKYVYDLVSKKTCEKESGMLISGFVPVKYDNNNWIVVSSLNKNNEWYDYDNQKWANVVVLSQEAKNKHKDEVGSIISVDGENPDAVMMYVWIPRYEYKIVGQYGTHTDGTTGTEELPGEIEIKFIDNLQTNPDSGYIIHPAFTFGEETKNGFWIGKFELSHETLKYSSEKNRLGCTNNSDGIKCSVDATKFRVLPNAQSLTNNDVANFWYGVKKIENEKSFGFNNVDIHVIKGSEWGAVAYLSQSKYGKYGNTDYTGVNKEIYQNKSNDFITGKSNGTPTQAVTNTQCAYNDMTNMGTGKGQCGPGASTTGNIYGVYDMNGGAWEAVMGALGDSDGIYSGYNATYNSGFKGKYGTEGENTSGLDVPTIKYYDKYTTNDLTTACNNGICYGHALSETMDWYGSMQNINIGYPWMIRGGIFGNDYSSIFENISGNGTADEEVSTRIVGFLK